MRTAVRAKMREIVLFFVVFVAAVLVSTGDIYLYRGTNIWSGWRTVNYRNLVIAFVYAVLLIQPFALPCQLARGRPRAIILYLAFLLFIAAVSWTVSALTWACSPIEVSRFNGSELLCPDAVMQYMPWAVEHCVQLFIFGQLISNAAFGALAECLLLHHAIDLLKTSKRLPHD